MVLALQNWLNIFFSVAFLCTKLQDVSKYCSGTSCRCIIEQTFMFVIIIFRFCMFLIILTLFNIDVSHQLATQSRHFIHKQWPGWPSGLGSWSPLPLQITVAHHNFFSFCFLAIFFNFYGVNFHSNGIFFKFTPSLFKKKVG